MAEGGRDHALAAGAHDAAGGGVLQAGLDGVRLDPLQGGPNSLVVGGDDAPVRAHEGEQENGLGGGEGDIAAGAVGDVAVAAAEAGTAGHAALQDGLQGSGVDGPRAAAPPPAQALASRWAGSPRAWWPSRS